MAQTRRASRVVRARSRSASARSPAASTRLHVVRWRGAVRVQEDEAPYATRAEAARWTPGDVELAEEATQGAMERFLRYRAYERVDSDGAAVAYLVRTAARLIMDDRRRRARESPLPSEGVPDHAQPEAGHDLGYLFSQIPDDDRQLLELVVEGYSLREIAEILGLRYSAVAMRIHRARNRLREKLHGM